MIVKDRPSALPILLLAGCVGAAIAACGGAGDTGGGGGESTFAQTSSTGPGHGSTTGSGEGGGIIDPGDGGTTQTLTVEPAMAALTITQPNAPKLQQFKAKVDGVEVTGPVTWALDTYAIGSITTGGQFATTGLAGGKITITATYGSKKAVATLTVGVDLSDTTDMNVAPGNLGALQGTPEADPGASTTPPNPTKILYPYDKTVMPRGLTAPLLQFSPGNVPPEDAKIALKSTYFSWQGYVHVANGATPQFSIPQDIWDAALTSSGGEKLVVDVTKAAAGHAYGPAETSVIVAPASLKGAVYYMTYQTPNNGLYSVRPGVRAPATLIKPGCLVCHAVSANGTRLALGTDDPPSVAESGIYNVGSDGTAAQLTQSPATLGGDSRGISFATFTPDGKYVMRSMNNFWGGVGQSAWKINDAAATLDPATVVGLDGVAALVPAISADGKHYGFTNGAEESVPFGTPSRSISTMDLATDPATNTLTFSNRRLLLDNGPTGSVAKFVNFLPDPNFVVLQEGEGYQAAYEQMLPTWDANSTFTDSTGRLYMVKAATGEHIELATLNAGNVEIDRQRNYEPFPLPVTAGGYFWIVFTSIREYGNTYQGANVQKQLWVAAISTNPGPGEDPSHPPFYLPNQSDTRNERGYWALEPCKADGLSCETGDECCDGFCRPSDPDDPSSAKVCQPPPVGGCSETSERCTTTADCCDAATGTKCIGGFCTQPGPH